MSARTSRFAGVIREAERCAIPLTVSIELTQRCNFRCVHCYLGDLGAQGAVGSDRLASLLEELAGMGTLFLVFTGGEPLLRPDTLALASLARRLGFSLALLTNGSLVDERTADALAQLVVQVSISLYGPTAEVFEGVTRVPGSFEKVCRAVELLRARGVDVLLKVPILTVNRLVLSETLALAASLGAEAQAFHVVTPRSDGGREPLGLRVCEGDLESYYRDSGMVCRASDARRRGVAADEPLCAAASRLAHVTAAGDVQACVDIPVSDANISERSFREIWEGSQRLARVRAIRPRDLPMCGNCEKLAYCGRCHGLALVEDGDLLGRSSWACEHAATLERLQRDASAVPASYRELNPRSMAGLLPHLRAAGYLCVAASRLTTLARKLPFDEVLVRLREGRKFLGPLADPLVHARVVNRLLPLLPPWRMGVCMKRSLLLLHLWSRCGLAPRLHLGFRPSTEGPWDGHAWLSTGDPSIDALWPAPEGFTGAFEL